MARPKIYGNRTTITVLLDSEILGEIEKAVKEKKISSRNELFNQALKVFISGSGVALGDLERIRARLTEGYCMAHKIFINQQKLASLDPHLKITAEARELHEATVSWLENVDLT